MPIWRAPADGCQVVSPHVVSPRDGTPCFNVPITLYKEGRMTRRRSVLSFALMVLMSGGVGVAPGRGFEAQPQAASAPNPAPDNPPPGQAELIRRRLALDRFRR